MRNVAFSCLVALAAGLAAVAACGAPNGGDNKFAEGGGGAGNGGASGAGGGAAGSAAAAGGINLDGAISDSPAQQDGDACGSVDLVGVQSGNVIVVFDQSNSMKQNFTNPDSGVAKAKFLVAGDALMAAVGPIQSKLNVGTIFFPTIATGNTCSLVDPISNAPPQIAIEPGAQFVTDWPNHFAPPWTLILGTPLKDALVNADLAYVDPSPLVGARVVVVITDGAPTCDTVQANILAPVKSMFARGIKTYVVGLPGSSAASTLLDAIANAGGTTQYLSPADPAALEAQLSSIAGSAIDKCVFTFTPPPPDADQVHLMVTDAQNPTPHEVPQGDGGDGWTLSPDGSTATLTGAVCDKAKAGDYGSIQFIFGCPGGPS